MQPYDKDKDMELIIGNNIHVIWSFLIASHYMHIASTVNHYNKLTKATIATVINKG